MSSPRHPHSQPHSAGTNKLITAKDHASVQINVGHLDEDGKLITGQFTTFAFAGAIRSRVSCVRARCEGEEQASGPRRASSMAAAPPASAVGRRHCARAALLLWRRSDWSTEGWQARG